MPKDLFPDIPNLDLLPDEPNAQAPIQYGKIAKDVGRDALNILNIPEKILKGMWDLPGEARGAANQISNNPQRVLQNIGSAVGNAGHSMWNVPGNVRDYVVDRGGLLEESIPSFRLPENILPRDFNYKEALGSQGNESGDNLISGITELLTSSAFGGPIVGNTLNSIGKNEGIIAPTVEMGLFTGTKGNIQRAPKYKRSLSQADTAADFYNNYVKKHSQLAEEYKKGFDTPGLPDASIYIPEIESLNTLEKSIPPKVFKEINKNIAEQSPLGLQWAQSKLGEIERGLEREAKKGGSLTGEQNTTLKAVTKMRSEIQDLLKDSLNLSENPNLSQWYEQQTNKFRQELGQPYEGIKPEIDLFGENRISSKDFIDAINSEKGREARHMYGHETAGLERATTTSTAGNLLGQVPLLKHFIDLIKKKGGG